NDKFLDKEHRYRHSTWLEFMHRRLTLARDLLAEDGVIFVSISEHEHARLELLMEEIFPGMKVGNFVWRTRSGANDEKDWFVSVDHEYVLCYANPGFSFAGSKKARPP
ncbi:MAG: site-specific DNA-methyltransferase, partial [Armatimonadota bacterium]